MSRLQAARAPHTQHSPPMQQRNGGCQARAAHVGPLHPMCQRGNLFPSGLKPAPAARAGYLFRPPSLLRSLIPCSPPPDHHGSGEGGRPPACAAACTRSQPALQPRTSVGSRLGSAVDTEQAPGALPDPTRPCLTQTLCRSCPPAAQSLKVTATFGGKTKVRGGMGGRLVPPLPLPPGARSREGGNRAAHACWPLTCLLLHLVPPCAGRHQGRHQGKRQQPGWAAWLTWDRAAARASRDARAGASRLWTRRPPPACAARHAALPAPLLVLLQKGTQKQATTKKAAPKKSSSGASQWVSSKFLGEATAWLVPGWPRLCGCTTSPCHNCE